MLVGGRVLVVSHGMCAFGVPFNPALYRDFSPSDLPEEGHRTPRQYVLVKLIVRESISALLEATNMRQNMSK